MTPPRDEVLSMLEDHARLAGSSGPVELSSAYLRAVELWQDLPENAPGADKSWVEQSRREFAAHFARARAGR